MDGNVRKGATISGNMMREKPSDGVEAPICGNMDTGIGTERKTQENAVHRSLQPSENIRFLEEQLEITRIRTRGKDGCMYAQDRPGRATFKREGT